MAYKGKTTDVAVIDNDKSAALNEMREAIRSMIAKSDVTAEEIALQIISADTLDGILGSTAIGLDDMIGVPFTIERVELRESEFADGLPAYAVMHATLDDGESVIITSGATSVVAQCVSMVQGGFLPVRVSSRKPSKPTANGYYPVSLCKAPAYIAEQHENF